jgi:hypothetical protein
VKEDEMGGATCHAWRKLEICTEPWPEILKERDNLEGVDGMIILKLVLKKTCTKM